VQSPSNACVNWPAFTLSAGSPNGGTYSGTGVSGNTFDPSVSGTGTFYVLYTYTDQNGCTGVDSSAISVGLCTAIANAGDLTHIQVYPNPFNEKITIALGEKLNAEITLWNVVGENIGTWRADGLREKMEIDPGQLASGIYFIKVKTESGTITRKVVKQ
jgi:hypothetical protein